MYRTPTDISNRALAALTGLAARRAPVSGGGGSCVEIAAVVAALAAGLGACGGPYPQSAVHPASDMAVKLDDLFDQILWWAAGVFVVVQGILFYTLFRFREKQARRRPREFHGHTLLEIGWTLVPALILVAIAVPTIRVIFEVDRPTTDENALVVEVEARRWWWEFSYPEYDLVTANEMHIPVGRTIDVRMRSADVLHSFWVPRLGGKRDVVPGRENHIWFKADSTGVFLGQCAEFCGVAHALMGFRVIVQDPSEFQEWVGASLLDAPRPTSADGRAGAGVFATSACVGCHTVRGVATAQQGFGPDLTHFGSRLTIGAGILENNVDNLVTWLDSTQHVKPGALMPEVEMSEEQLRQLARFLLEMR